jgi:general secretion pathway protein J
MNRRTMQREYGQLGFTLLEILVAIAIFVVVSALAMGGYVELDKQSRIVSDSTARTRAIQATVQRMSQDFATLEPRPVREPLGDTVEPALRSEAGTERLVSLTRSGWTNPAGVPRSTLQRVSYRLQEDKLKRDYWVVLDRTLSVEPVSVTLLDRVRSVSFRFMDGNQSWHESWPAQGLAGRSAARLRPIAVEITLELEDWGKIVRLVETTG